MTQSVARIMEEAAQLTITEREDLADLLVESLARDIPPEIERAQLAEVRRRIEQVESGEVEVIPGPEALEHVRRSIAAARAER